MILIIKNQTVGTLTYLGGAVSVAGSSNYTATSSTLYPLSRDPGLIMDCTSGNVLLNDGITDWGGVDAITYLNQVASSLGGAVVGFAGANAPSYQITVGGKDNAGKSQPARMNQFADLATNYRNSYSNITGNTTSTIKGSSGTLHGVLINNNGTGGAVKMYDSVSGGGTVIATFKVGSITTAAGPTFIGPLGLEFGTGLTIVTSGSASNDVTILYQ